MSRKLVSIAIMTLSLFVSSAGAKTSKHINKIILLPVEQSDMPDSSKLSDKQLSDAMIVHLARLKSYELAEFSELSKALDDNLIDDAVFELLVTDGLEDTLAKLHVLETETTRLAEYCKIGKELGVDYLVSISIEQDSSQLRATYKIIDSKTSQIAFAKSFYEQPNDPVGLSDEIAKRVVRRFWQLQNK